MIEFEPFAVKVKNLGPKDQALGCPWKGLLLKANINHRIQEPEARSQNKELAFGQVYFKMHRSEATTTPF
jgi:hypothetical protein